MMQGAMHNMAASRFAVGLNGPFVTRTVPLSDVEAQAISTDIANLF
jgi:hypothetical protein